MYSFCILTFNGITSTITADTIIEAINKFIEEKNVLESDITIIQKFKPKTKQL